MRFLKIAAVGTALTISLSGCVASDPELGNACDLYDAAWQVSMTSMDDMEDMTAWTTVSDNTAGKSGTLELIHNVSIEMAAMSAIGQSIPSDGAIANMITISEQCKAAGHELQWG